VRVSNVSFQTSANSFTAILRKFAALSFFFKSIFASGGRNKRLIFLKGGAASAVKPMRQQA